MKDDDAETANMNGNGTIRSNQLLVVYEGDEEPVERCGIGPCKPDFLQRCRNMKMFLLVFILAGVSQGMFYTYWNTSLSSIEKRFQIPSQTTGIISAINDVSHIAVVLFVAHFCGRGHRPRWMGLGLFITGLAILTFATPELIAPKWEAESHTLATQNQSSFEKDVCLTDAQSEQIATQCLVDAPKQINKNFWAFFLLGVAQLLLGVGTTAPIVLAMPYIDDNVKTKDTPIYFSLGFTGRLVGPLAGVMLGSYCLSTYIDLKQSPNIAQTDPRWMGAWYLGFLVVGSTTCMVSFLYLFFPKHMVPPTPAGTAITKSVKADARNGQKATQVVTKKLNVKDKKTESLREQLAGLPRDLKRLFVNKIFVARTANDCIDMLVVSGYFSFAPKYLEYHFRMSPAQAGKWNGLASIMSIAGGAMVGGVIIRKLRFGPKQVALMICVSSLMISLCYFFLMMVSCGPRNLYSELGSNNMLEVNTPCTNGCHCAGRPFSPVCDESTGISYYSPCHAGCPVVLDSKNKTKYYSNCTCLVSGNWKFSDPIYMPPADLNADAFSHVSKEEKYYLSADFKLQNRTTTVRRGYCEFGGCAGFWTYVLISTVFKFVGALPFSGNQMLSFRIVDPDLKSLSKAVRILLASMFAFIPGPIIMGAVIDSTCRLWNTQECGQKGACLIYDLDSLRVKMHLYVAIVKTLACVSDVYVYFKVRNMKFERDLPKSETTVEVADDPRKVFPMAPPLIAPLPHDVNATDNAVRRRMSVPQPVTRGSVRDLTVFD